MPPEMVDVNVHPTKLEVRFQDSGRLYSQLLATLRRKFLTSDLSTHVQTAAGQRRTDRRPRRGPGRRDAAATGRLGQGQDGLLAAARPRPAPEPGQGPGSAASSPRDAPALGWRCSRWSCGRSIASWPRAAAAAGRPTATDAATAAGRPRRPCKSTTATWWPRPREGVTIIDQHALHERILYEQLRQRIEAGLVETQSLLVPEPVDLGPPRRRPPWSTAICWRQLGMRIEPFGGDTVLDDRLPGDAGQHESGRGARGLVERLLAGGKQPDRRDCSTSCLHTIACKAAMKAGDRLAPDEIAVAVGAAAPGRRSPIIVPTAGPRHWSSPARSWTGSFGGRREGFRDLGIW